MPHANSTNRQKKRSGATTVEVAVLAIPFFVFVFGILESGRLFLVKDLITEASREAARLASVNTNVTGTNTNDLPAAAIRAKAEDLLKGHSLNALSIEIYPVNDPDSSWKTQATLQHQIAVEITANYKPMTPLMSIFSGGQFDSIPLKATTIAYSEGH